MKSDKLDDKNIIDQSQKSTKKPPKEEIFSDLSIKQLQEISDKLWFPESNLNHKSTVDSNSLFAIDKITNIAPQNISYTYIPVKQIDNINQPKQRKKKETVLDQSKKS